MLVPISSRALFVFRMAYKQFLNLGFNSYREYLASPLWKNAKRKLRNGKDGTKLRRCEICGIRCFTHVHHRTYRRLGKEEKKDLIEVCKKCHYEIHEIVSSGMRLFDAAAHLKAKKRKVRSRERYRQRLQKEETLLPKPKIRLIKKTTSDWVHALPWNI